MSKQRYPRLGHAKPYKPNVNHQCVVCKNRASHRAEVQWWYMRGDDESYNVCQEHLSNLKEGNFKFLEGSKP